MAGLFRIASILTILRQCRDGAMVFGAKTTFSTDLNNHFSLNLDF
jgi:hypothetical protein